ncbi:hypothetical protein [Pontibacter ramchanderi]|uniref:hypothetical protein n=1 Tax=Pontibacter ramchanderi TaxID=1179743 RepID=UPI0011806904|nr:hypothetical protein [Pontibacter ramchanderi]
MIILEDKSTWPQEVMDFVAPDMARISQERELELAKNLEGKSWLSTIPDSIYVQTQQHLATILRRYSIKAYHATKLPMPEIVLRTGLLPLSDQTLATALSEVVAALPSSDSGKEAQKELNQFVRSEAFENQRGLVWVYLTELQTQQYDSQDLLEFYGGRALRAALANKRYKYFPLLKRLGVPVLITCSVRIADAAEAQVYDLAKLMLDNLLDAANGLAPRSIAAELAISAPVPATAVFEVNELLQYA